MQMFGARFWVYETEAAAMLQRRDRLAGAHDFRRIDAAKVVSARKSIPSLQHGRRFSLVDPKAGPEHLHLVRGSV